MKMILSIALALILAVLGPTSYGQNAIVVLDSTHVKCSSILEMTTTHHKTITVLNKTGAEYANFLYTTNKTRTLKNFKCTINAGGKTKKSFGKKDVNTTELSENMADDYTTHFLEISYPFYPYTVVMEYQIEYSDGYISMPVFAPAYYQNAAVEKAVYHLETPSQLGYSYKAVNTDIMPETQEIKGIKHAIWRMYDLKPYKNDAFMPPHETILPHIYITPDKFSYYNIEGNSSSWHEYGKWQWGLMEGRDSLPQKLKEIVHNLTDTILCKRDKIKALYNYLGNTTRYVSIQMGLGGLQPMSADEVYKYGFGDCKALSNYLKAMLKECGIESNYVEINTDNPVIFKDHASVLQTNHAILKVPDENGDLWLECTNTDIPFGFIHNNIAGHDAVVYANGSASIETLPNYQDSTNHISTDIHISISENGSSTITVNEKYENKCSESLFGISKANRNKQTDIIKSMLSTPSCAIQEIEIKEDFSGTPSVKLLYTATSDDFVSTSGNRIFIPLSIYNATYPKFNKSRMLDIVVEWGYNWHQKIVIEWPKGYNIESIPQRAEFASTFGNMSIASTVHENSINIVIERNHTSGTFKGSQLEEFKKFFSFIEKIYNQKIIINKE